VKLIKDNSYDIVRLIINQVGISIFALVLYTSLGFIGENSEELAFGLRAVFSAFSIIFYWALLYTATWEMGAKDKIRIDGGKLEDVKNKGMILSSVANVPNVLLAVLAIVFCGIYLLTGAEILNTAFLIVNLLMRLFASMYIGIISFVCEPLVASYGYYYLTQSLCFLVLPLLTVAVCHVGYSFGRKDFKIFGKKM
jgi:hypothetical protein